MGWADGARLGRFPHLHRIVSAKLDSSLKLRCMANIFCVTALLSFNKQPATWGTAPNAIKIAKRSRTFKKGPGHRCGRRKGRLLSAHGRRDLGMRWAKLGKDWEKLEKGRGPLQRAAGGRKREMGWTNETLERLCEEACHLHETRGGERLRSEAERGRNGVLSFLSFSCPLVVVSRSDIGRASYSWREGRRGPQIDRSSGNGELFGMDAEGRGWFVGGSCSSE